MPKTEQFWSDDIQCLLHCQVFQICNMFSKEESMALHVQMYPLGIFNQLCIWRTHLREIKWCNQSIWKTRIMFLPIHLKNMNNCPNLGHQLPHTWSYASRLLFLWSQHEEDNSIKLSVLQVRVQLHFFRVNAMQQCGTQSFQLC